jgi:hypothetical protein
MPRVAVARPVRRGCALSGAIVAALVWLVPSPYASAHAAGDAPPATDYLTTIDHRPGGVEVRVIDGGDRLELTLDGARQAVVSGFAGEPMYRLDARGVAENRRSPSLAASRTRDGGVDVPADADPSAAPEWVHVSDRQVLRWHDHRAHWMGVERPPEVDRDPGRARVVMGDWTVPLVVDGHDAEIGGDVTWQPRPPTWPWWVAVLTASVAMLVLADVRPRLATRVGVTLAIVGVAATLTAAWDPDPGDVAAHLLALAVPVAWLALVPVGAWLARTRPVAGAALVAVGAIGTLALVAWPRRGVVSHAVIVSNWPTGVTQLALGAVVVGLIGACAGSSRQAFGGDGPGVLRGLRQRDDQLPASPEHPRSDRAHGHVQHGRGLLVRAAHDPREHQGLTGVEG